VQEKALPKVFSPLPDEEVLRVLKPERMAFLWLFLGVGVLMGLGLVFFRFFPPVGLFLTAVGILGLLITFFYSGAFTYYLTTKRIILYRRFITISSRQIQYDDLSDVMVDQGIIGRLFGFGNVIPITKSGLGTEMRGWQMGGGWGGAGPIVVAGPMVGEIAPSTSPSTCLYGIKNPFEIKDLIFKYQEEYAEAPYLKRIAKTVEEKPGAIKGMRYCPFCGSKLEVEGARFCPSCGKEVLKA